MAWEDRGASTPYYYRKVRGDGGQVRSVYVGKGPLAECVAEMDAAARAARRYHTEAVRQTEAVLDGAGEASEALTAAVQARLGSHMTGLGFTYHRGDWRRPRVRKAGISGTHETALTRPRPDGRNLIYPPAPVPSTRQIRGISVENHEVTESEPLPDVAGERSPTGDLIRSLHRDAWGLRVMAERAVMRGEGSRENRIFRAFAAAGRSVVDCWGGVVVDPVDPDEESPLERRRRDGRVARGRMAAARPHAGLADETALAVAAVLDEVGQDGRNAVTSALHGVRTELEWAMATPVGRVVIDQYALARVHADLVAAFAAGSTEERARQHRLQGPQTPAGSEALIEALADALGPTGAIWAVRARRSAYAATLIPTAAWPRRARRSRRRLSDAARLVRHARKAGLILGSPSSVGPPHPPASASHDPIVALAGAAPLDPLAGEAAEWAERSRARIDARRAAWPPPDLTTWSELSDTAGLWSVWDYAPSETDPEGRPHDGSVWASRCHPPEHPHESLAALASWAPEYAEPLGDPSLDPARAPPTGSSDTRRGCPPDRAGAQAGAP